MIVTGENKRYDIAVIGGGLAGLCLAIQAAKKKYTVALFEKETYPFHKVCGEYISKESWKFLMELGLPLESMQLPDINQLQVTSTSGNSFEHALTLGGFGISRFLLDAQLEKIAKNEGVTIFTSKKVTDIEYHKMLSDFNSHFIISTKKTEEVKDTFEARVVVGSFGKRSNLDVQWKRDFTITKPNKLNNYIGIKYHIRYPHNVNTIALHNFENGYCGMSKIEQDKSCLCYLTTAENLQKSNNSIQQMEQTILCKNLHLKEIFKNAEFLFPHPLAISQISFQKKTIVENNVLMVGDAAGMITPLCGNGMSMAMHASKLAFYEIDYFLFNKITRSQMERQYEAKWNETFSKRLSVGRMVQSLFGGELTSNFLVKTMKRFPNFAYPLIKATHGESF